MERWILLIVQELGDLTTISNSRDNPSGKVGIN